MSRNVLRSHILHRPEPTKADILLALTHHKMIMKQRMAFDAFRNAADCKHTHTHQQESRERNEACEMFCNRSADKSIIDTQSNIIELFSLRSVDRLPCGMYAMM